MASFKNILLCYDSTLEGRRALIQGAELAEVLRAETHLLAIAKTLTGGSMVELPSRMAMREEEKHVRDILRDGVERLRQRGLVATGHLTSGRALDQIPAVAHALGVDLIIVGHRPASVLARWWSGPGNAQLLERVGCSVLISIDPADAGWPAPP